MTENTIETRLAEAMTEGSNISSTPGAMPAFMPASMYRDELMTIFIWPFVLIILYTIVGTIGNLVVLYIYIFRWKKTKTRIFIVSLALFNFVNCAFNMPVEAYILWHPLQFDNHWLCKMTRGVTFIINNVCPCIFVAIAIDRMLLVYRPLKRIAYTVRYAKQACFLAFVVGTVTSWPGMVFYGTATLPEKLDSVIVIGKTCYVSDYFLREENVKWPSLFNVILFALMITVYVLLAVMYILIGKKIYQVTKCDMDEKQINSKRFSRNKSFLQSIRRIAVGSLFQKSYKVESKSKLGVEPIRREPSIEDDVRSVSFEDLETCGQSQPSSKSLQISKETKTKPPRMSRRISSVNAHASKGNTITMTLITVAYMISFLPYVIIVSLRYYNKNYYFTLDKSQKIVYHVFLRTYFLNSVINPIIYSFTNKEFRGVLKKLSFRLAQSFRRR